VLKLFGRLLKVGHRPTGETCLAEGKTPKKVIVAVHGIGDQVRYTTVQAVGRQFFRYVGLAGALPLGALYSVLKREPPSARQGCYGFLPSSGMGDLGLAEVYWADIPRVPETELYTVEETKAWARTVVERLRLRHEMQTEKSDLELTDLDVLTMKEVLSEMIDTIRILEWLLAWVERQTKFTFPLKQVLTDYLGDVQIVADYKPFRRKIVDEFHAVLSGICSVKSPPEIYIVAHSEGTVVSLLAMLEAMNEKSGIDGGWVRQVRGFMTIGSPIDKHLILWPELFASFEPKTAAELHLGEVSWRKMETIQ
jgi:hypothetical protein